MALATGILAAMNHFDLTNHFLIAMPTLADPNFSRTVTYICAHNEEGAMGIVVNRPIDIELGEVLAQMDLAADDPAVSARPVYQGGPVHTDRGFVLHRPAREWSSTITVTAEVGISTSRDILEAISAGTGPADSLVALGYAGWGAGQLEQEMADNAWLSGPADLAIVFETPSELRWQRAAALIGIDLTAMSHDVGHA
ncbi:MAG: YqgE/AlgH family protein [Gammaproteobacteria bacterium]